MLHPYCVVHVAKHLCIRYGLLSLRKEVVNSSSQGFHSLLLLANVLRKELNRLVQVEARKSVLQIWAPIRADGASGATGY